MNVHILNISTDVAVFCTFSPVQLNSYGSKLGPVGDFSSGSTAKRERKGEWLLGADLREGSKPTVGLNAEALTLKGTFVCRKKKNWVEGGGQMLYWWHATILLSVLNNRRPELIRCCFKNMSVCVNCGWTGTCMWTKTGARPAQQPSPFPQSGNSWTAPMLISTKGKVEGGRFAGILYIFLDQHAFAKYPVWLFDVC